MGAMGRFRACRQERIHSTSLHASVAACLASAICVAAAWSAADAEASPKSAGRPNVVVVETDDQTVEQLRVMQNVEARIADEGATFANSFVNLSRCCPSRATLLTGEYAHNHGVLDNSGPQGGFHTFQRLHGSNNLAVWLQRAGYYTGLIGKYLNGYNEQVVPRGWNAWDATVGGNAYDYDMNQNGTIVHYGTAAEDYREDVLTGKAVDFVDRRAPKSQPFFLWLTYSAPHIAGPDPNPQPPTSGCENAAKPAPRHAGVFDSEPLPMPPNFNEADVSDKPQAIQDLPLLDSGDIADIRRVYRCDLESLLSVDEGVGQVLDALVGAGELSNTYVIVTSDNGFFYGEHRIPTGKTQLYEESIRVPLLIRGPRIPHGVTVRDLAVNADLAPTIARATGADPRLPIDGKSLLPVARHPEVERGREILIEGPDFRAIRTQRYVYGEYTDGEKELYDLKTDPYELENVSSDPAHLVIRRHLARRLAKLRSCSAGTCRLRPHLRLELRHRSLEVDGHRCARAPLRVRVAGGDARDLVQARFFADGSPAGVDRSAPFKHKVPAHRLRAGRISTISVRASLLDGRRMTLDRRILVCG
jgi:N-acetylglucosamine-6-sulfatase